MAVPLVYVLLLYFLASAASSTVMSLRFRGRPVVLDSELSVSARYQKTRTAARAASSAAACCSSERRCAA